MKQVENYKPKYVPRSLTDTKEAPDSYWKHPQRKSQSFPNSRDNRNPEALTSCYSSFTSYKPQRSHVCSSPPHSKYTSRHTPEGNHHVAQEHCRSTKIKRYPAHCPVVRKPCFEDELYNNEKLLKYINEESENFTDDNAEEDADEEEDDHVETGEFLEKDFEGQEEDDETEEEFVAFQQTRREHSPGKKDALLKRQQWRAVEYTPDKFRCQQRMELTATGRASSPRYYHNGTEHDVAEPLSDEDFVLTPLKGPLRRSSADYHQWSQAKNEPDRYDDDPLPVQPSRRPRAKPDVVEQLINSELSRARRCHRCGSLSNKKNELPSNHGCRFDDQTNLPSKGSIDDELGGHEQLPYGRCNQRHNPKSIDCANDAGLPLYSTKSRRFRDAKSPIPHKMPGPIQMDKHSTDYPRYSARYQRKPEDVYPEKMKHTVHGTARISSRYID